MLDLILNDDQTMIIDSVRGYVAEELPLDRLQPKATPIDPAKAHVGLAELGWLGVGLAEDVGGSGLGLLEEALVHRECGRQLASPSIVASVLGAHVALAAGDAELAGKLVSGEVRAAAAILAERGEPGPTLSAYALDWKPGDLLLAWNADGIGLYASDGFTGVEPHEGLDQSLPSHAGKLARGGANLWSDDAALGRRAEVLLAATMVGMAEKATEVTVEYAKVREQFGKPIGHFQAVKHRITDMGVRSELCWGQTCMAALKVQAGAPDAALQASAAKLNAANAAHENGRASIQMHGGMGYHAEVDAHWFMKRAHVLDHIGPGMRQLARRVIAEPSPLW